MATKNNPGAYDCYANAHPDEPMFILLGRDPLAQDLVRIWAVAALEMENELPAKISEALNCAKSMDEWLMRLNKQPKSVLYCIPFNTLADELRRRGATVTPAPYGGDFREDEKTGIVKVNEDLIVQDFGYIIRWPKKTN